MPTAKEILNRMNSVVETQKITNAMYLIASTKLQKARKDLQNTRPYFDALLAEIKRIFRVDEDIENRFFYPPGKDITHEGRYGILVITGDKGLAGSYNQNVIREALKVMKEHPDHELFVVGEFGRKYFNSHNIPLRENFLYTAQNPTTRHAREICAYMLERYIDGCIDKIYIVYTDMEKGEATPRSSRLLPFHRSNFVSPIAVEKPLKDRFEFRPSLEGILDGIVQSYVSGFVYSALVDSYCCEQNARMSAMDASNRNAEELLTALGIQYNRVRQAAITQEITEVTAGARAQKLKRLKKKRKAKRCIQEG